MPVSVYRKPWLAGIFQKIVANLGGIGTWGAESRSKTSRGRRIDGLVVYDVSYSVRAIRSSCPHTKSTRQRDNSVFVDEEGAVPRLRIRLRSVPRLRVGLLLGPSLTRRVGGRIPPERKFPGGTAAAMFLDNLTAHLARTNRPAAAGRLGASPVPLGCGRGEGAGKHGDWLCGRRRCGYAGLDFGGRAPF